jgi:spore coat polysaccharide biosynthesis protein SpsF (cytidylyltransferase family)
MKEKKKLTPAQKAAREKRKKEHMTVFMNGKQKRFKRSTTINGMRGVDESAIVLNRYGRTKTKCGNILI